jgi:hypothetical protein
VEILSRKRQTPSSPALRRSGRQGKGEVESERFAPRSLEGVGHLVTLGNMNDRSGADDGRFAEMLRSELARLLEGMSGVAVLSDPSAVDRTLEKEIRRRGICRLRIDGTVVEVKRDIHKGEVSSSCAVSLMVLEDPGMIIRAVLSGSATSKGLQSKTAERQKQALLDQALRSAVRSALSNFGSVMARSDGGAKRAGRKRNSGAVLKSSVALANPSKP